MCETGHGLQGCLHYAFKACWAKNVESMPAFSPACPWNGVWGAVYRRVCFLVRCACIDCACAGLAWTAIWGYGLLAAWSSVMVATCLLLRQGALSMRTL